MDFFVVLRKLAGNKDGLPCTVEAICWSEKEAMSYARDMGELFLTLDEQELPPAAQGKEENCSLRWRKLKRKGDFVAVADLIVAGEVVDKTYAWVQSIDMTDSIVEMPEEVVEEFNGLIEEGNDLDAILVGDTRTPEQVIVEASSPFHPIQVAAKTSSALKIQKEVRQDIERLWEQEICPLGSALEEAIGKIVRQHGSFTTLAAVYVSMFRLEICKRNLIAQTSKKAGTNVGATVLSILAAVHEVVIEAADHYEEAQARG